MDLKNLSEKQLLAIANGDMSGFSKAELEALSYEPKKSPEVDSLSKLEISPVEADMIALGNRFNLIPSAMGVASGLKGLVSDPLGKDSFEKPYIQSRDQAQQVINKAREQYPVRSALFGLAGSIPEGRLLGFIPGLSSLIGPTSGYLESAVKSTGLGGLLGFAQKPEAAQGSSPTEDMLQLGDRSKNAGVGMAVGLAASPLAHKLGLQAQKKAAAERFVNNKDVVQQELRDLQDKVSSQVEQNIINPAEEVIQANKDIKGNIPLEKIDYSFTDPRTDRRNPAFEAIRQELLNRATKTKVIPGAPIKENIVDNSLAGFGVETPQRTIGTQISYGKELAPEAEATLGELTDIKRYGGRLAKHADTITAANLSGKSVESPARTLEQFAKNEINRISPEAGAALERQSQGLEAINRLQTFGGGAKAPIRQFTSNELGDMAAEIQNIERMAGTNALSKKAQEMRDIKDFLRPYKERWYEQPINWIRDLSESGTGNLGKTIQENGPITSAALIQELAKQRARLRK